MNRLPEMVARKAKLAQTGGASQRLHKHTRGLPSLTVHPKTYPVSIDAVPYFVKTLVMQRVREGPFTTKVRLI